MMENIKRNVDFLKSILRESNGHRRMEKLLHANKDQINAVSKFTLNMLKKMIPLPPPIVAKLEIHKAVLREVAKRKSSSKKWCQLLADQKGSGFWRGMNDCSLFEEMSDDEGYVTVDEVDTGIMIQFEYNDDDSDDSPECVTWFGQCVQWIYKHVLQKLLRLWRRL